MRPGVRDLSGSLVFAAQKRAKTSSIPVFGGCSAGVVFRPGKHTKVRCGNGGDAGGHCHDLCKHVTDVGDGFDYPGDGCNGGSWAPRDIGIYLERVTRSQEKSSRSYCIPNWARSSD